MMRALFLSLGQLADAAVLRVLAKALALTAVLFVAIGGGAWWLLQGLLAGWTAGRPLAGVLALAATAASAWLLFRAVSVAAVGLFADEVVVAVERRHYPEALASARPLSAARGAEMALRSFARAMGLNLLLLPLYLLLLATGVGTAALFLAANAWALGRDWGDMVAARHLSPAQVAEWRARTGARRFALGLAGTGLFVVPGLNLVAPVLGAAVATHLFHGTRM